MEQDRNTSAAPSTLKTYKVRSGTINLGNDYEIKMTALLVLKCISCGFEDVWIASNADGTGAFDDVILIIKLPEGDHLSFMIQLKHNDKPKDITKQQFLKTEGDFALPKYFKSINDLYESKAAKTEPICEDLGNNIYFVLFTNRGLPKSELKPKDKILFLKRIEDTKIMFLNTGENKNIYKVNISELPSHIKLSKANNYDKVFLFANQVHTKQVKGLIEDEITNMVGPSKPVASIATKFIDFIRNWAKGSLGGHYYLTKKDVIYQITELVLSKYEIELGQEEFMVNKSKELNIWHQVVAHTTVTMVEFSEIVPKFLIKYICSEISKYYGGRIKTWEQQICDDDLSNSNYASQMHKIRNNGKISLLTIYKCMWSVGKIPLVLEIKSANDYRNIINVLKLSKYAYKIIIVNKGGEILKIEESIATFVTMEDLHQANRELFLKQTVKIQGRSSVILGDLLDAEMFKYLRPVDLVHILSGDFSFGATLAPLPEYFIERTVTKNFIKREALEEIRDEVFLLKNCDIELSMERSQIDFDKLTRNTNIVWIKDQITDAQRRKFKDTNKSIHYLSVYNKNYLNWIWSDGNVKKLERFQVEVECIISDSFNCPVNIISDAPGMGKSVLMDFVAESAPATKWILKVNINEHRQYLRGDHCASASTKAAEHLQYFYQTSKNANTTNVKLDDAIFQKLTHTKDVIVLLDGFDEVSISYKNEATNIATSLYNEGYHIWLTTRPIMKEHLEHNFMTSAMNLNPFSIKDQKQFMSKYFGELKSALVLKSRGRKKIINQFIDKLLNAAQTNLNDINSQFTGIPLQTKLLTDVFKSECEQSLCSGTINLIKKFDLVYLYKNFIEKQTGILRKKHGESVMDDRFEYINHQSLFALTTVFAIDHLAYIKKELAQYCNAEARQSLRLQREGVMTISATNHVTFLHYTYAEYLAAQWLASNISHEDDAIKELAQGLIQERFTGDYKFVFYIFDRILSTNCLLHTAIINKELKDATNIIAANKESVNEIDQGGRSILHIIALYAQASRFYLPVTDISMYTLLTSIAQIQNKPVFKVELDTLGCSPLDYALANCFLPMAHQISTMLQIDSLNTQINRKYQNSYLTYYKELDNTFLVDALLRYFVLHDLMLNKTKLSDSAFTCLPDELKDLTMLQLAHTCNSQYKPRITIGSNLHYQVVFGTLTSVEELLSATTSSVNKPDFDGYTPLHYAVLHAKTDIVDLLLSNQAIVNKQNKDGDTPLHLSLLNYNETVIKSLLFQKEIDVNIQNREGKTVLDLYKNIGHKADGLKLLAKGDNKAVEKKLTHIKRYTPLHLALTEKNQALAQLIITQGADINEANEDGDAPLHISVLFGYLNIAELLILNGADVNSANKSGYTPLHLAVLQRLPEMVELLIGKGADIKIVNTNGDTPLHWALLKGHPQYVKLLITKDEDLNLTNRNGDTPLHLAVILQQLTIAEFLYTKGADINIANRNGETPLHWAVLLGDPECVTLLMSKVENVNIANKNGNTLLHLSLFGKNPKIAKLLIDKGSSVNVVNNNGQTPIDIAISKHSQEIIDLLESATIK